MFDSEILIGLFVVSFPGVFGYLIPTIADYFIEHEGMGYK